MRLAIIERIWRKIKQHRMVYTLLPQGKISNAVKPLAEYRYKPQVRQEEEKEGTK